MNSNRFFLFSLFIFVIVPLSLLTTSCEKGHLHGTGKVITEIRYTQAFHSVNISDNISVNFFFSASGERRLEVQGGELLLPKIQTVVKDSILYLSNENKWNWLRSYSKSAIQITIYTDQIQYIKYNGFKDIYFRDTLKTNYFRFEASGGLGKIDLKLETENTNLTIHKGSPDLNLSGSTNKLNVYHNGHGVLYALDLNVNDLTIHTKETAESYVAPLASIGATIEYIGNVYYRNNPQILWLVETNKGKLIKID